MSLEVEPVVECDISVQYGGCSVDVFLHRRKDVFAECGFKCTVIENLEAIRYIFFIAVDDNFHIVCPDSDVGRDDYVICLFIFICGSERI